MDQNQYQNQQQSGDSIVAGPTRVVVEKKTFEVSLRQNARGRFVRISELSGQRWNTVIVPESGLNEVVGAISALCA